MPFNIALSGLNAASKDLEVTANNIANTATTGFKGSRTQFAELFNAAGPNLSSSQTGSGVRLTNVAQQFTTGSVETTNNSLDFAISGDGFFTVRDGKGFSYTRAGAFQKDQNGYVMNASGQRLQVFPSVAGGTFDTSTLTDLQLFTAQNAAKATGTVQMSLNLPSDATPPATPFNPLTDPSSYNQATPFTAYDSLGATHSGVVYFAKDPAANVWNASLYIDGGSTGASQQLTFNSSGALVTPANGMLNFPAVSVSPGADPMQLNLDMSKATQFGNAYAASAINQNGYPTGILSSIDVSREGVVQAKYSNGQTSALGQLALAQFSNEQGLRQLDNTNWAASYDSGTPVMGAAGGGTFGSVQAGALEASNTADLTAQLVNMIKAQRNYQANAQVISTDNQLTQTIINIRS
ncbi:flagellar biosynthesis protein FlgE [Rhodanobacter thiooxydans]|uniref:Flagellar hook protein FlgE n=1 Tax=Rhodanobacter thiooxydans TaxID=416169 RepID=A0A154QJ62_9GAMM|nr:flagellar hook protein FlgE [Rhodanobacter thiooxydans]EIM02227.1 flagellar hook protein FlgE [Rhodanobacter thiooxydans LCS2]KZC23766.1 flagellar biosynthesis protein FlgE [Rhodanobacter thiooxydans]MCW0200540.1 flagellar hook protein FlgE [Rhodanobacter thiooxydans]